MRTHKRLFEKIISFENLLLAAKQAQRGKKMKQDVAKFNFGVEGELLRLQDELKSQAYRPGGYRHFYVCDPKHRLISAAPYRDRVVHHAFCNIIEPLFDKAFIYDSYACRAGKGTHRALDRCQEFLRLNRYVLQCDIQKYFPSINHKILLKIVVRKIKDEKVIWLAESILRTPFVHGIPIGNLTSQFFANLYLNELDYFVKFDLCRKYYLRYMDDFLIFGRDKKHLHKMKEEIRGFLEKKLRLSLHPKKAVVFPVESGVDFLGFRLFKNYRRIRKSNVKLFIKRMKRKQEQLAKGCISREEFERSLQAWAAHASYGDTYRLRKELFRKLAFGGKRLVFGAANKAVVDKHYQHHQAENTNDTQHHDHFSSPLSTVIIRNRITKNENTAQNIIFCASDNLAKNSPAKYPAKIILEKSPISFAIESLDLALNHFIPVLKIAQNLLFVKDKVLKGKSLKKGELKCVNGR